MLIITEHMLHVNKIRTRRIENTCPKMIRIQRPVTLYNLLENFKSFDWNNIFGFVEEVKHFFFQLLELDC